MMAHQIVGMYYVYVLQSKKDNNLYVGYTKDVPSRFEAHQNGEVDSTRDRRPLELVYLEGCKKQEDALKREKYLKTHYGRLYLYKRLKSYFTG